MKKFFLLMALVLTAGVVHAQGAYTPNFGNRAKLRTAERLNATFPTSSTNSNYGWDMNDANLRLGGGKLYWAPNYANNSDVEIITVNSLNTKLNGRNLLDVFENFVIRTYDFENYNGSGSVSYAVRFLDANNNLVTELRFWSDDVKIAPLRGIANKSESEINSIRKVVVRGNSGNGQVRIAEAYFISALPSTIDYTDKDGIDIGNAYIDPSYLIRSNRIWVDINEDDRSFYINLAAGTEFATLSFSLPYKTGIDMTDVTVVATDFFRNASPFNRCNYSNVRREMYNNTNNTERLVRKLYNSRFNGPFYDENNYDALPNLGYPEKAMKHINDIHWEAFEYPTTELRRIWCQDICFTKNKIKARVTRKEMEPNDWTNQPEGFRNSDYPVRPYYRTPDNWSDVVRGWYEDEDMDVYTDLSKFDKMRIIGSPNTTFKIRFATSLNGNNVTKWEEIFAKTDALGEVNIDLDVYPKFYLQAIHFDGLDVDGIREHIGNSDDDGTPQMSEIRKTHYVNDIELFEGYMCPGIPVTEDLSFEVEFSDEEVAKIRQLVKDYTGDKRASLMPILKNDAPELHERIAKAAFQEIYDFYLLDGLRNGYIELDEADQQRNFKKDLESGEFNPEEFIEDSVWYDEVPTDEDELFNLWEEWESDQFSSCGGRSGLHLLHPR